MVWLCIGLGTVCTHRGGKFATVGPIRIHLISNRDRRSVTKSALGGLMTIDWRESFSLKVAPDAANYGTTQWENEKAMLNVRYLLFLPLPLACPATLIISFPSETFLSHHYCPVVCFWKKKKNRKGVWRRNLSVCVNSFTVCVAIRFSSCSGRFHRSRRRFSNMEALAGLSWYERYCQVFCDTKRGAQLLCLGTRRRDRCTNAINHNERVACCCYCHY